MPVDCWACLARYQAMPRDDEPLRARLNALATCYPRYGYLLLHALFRQEGLVVNRKRTYRLYREAGLQVRTRRRKRLVRPRAPMPCLDRPNQRWSMDFVSDQLSLGRRFGVLNIVDDFSIECVGQRWTHPFPGVALMVDRFLGGRSIKNAGKHRENRESLSAGSLHLVHGGSAARRFIVWDNRDPRSATCDGRLRFPANALPADITARGSRAKLSRCSCIVGNDLE